MTIEEIFTLRLKLRKLTPETYTYIYNTLDDAALLEFLGLPDEEALQKEKDKYIKGLATYNRTFVIFQLIDKATGKIMGECGYHTWVPQHSRAEIFYKLTDDVDKKKGFMTEALVAVIGYGFNQMGLHRIEALTALYNNASLRLIEKFGFKKEGVLREHYNVDGKMEDSVMFSLLKHEYQQKL